MDTNPYESPKVADPVYLDPVQLALRRLQIPLLGLLVVSYFHLVSVIVIWGAIACWIFSTPGGPVPARALLVMAVAFLFSVLPPCIQLITVSRAMRGESLWICRAAALAACVPLISPGIVFGVQFGIWATILLFLPSTSAVFDQPSTTN